jgi:NADH-quinone oxidoreductase subunit N
MIGRFDPTGGALMALGMGAVAAMVLAPLAHTKAVRAVAAGSLAAALILTWFRLGIETGFPSDLMIEDRMAQFGRFVICLSALGALSFLRPAAPSKEAPALILIGTLGAAVLCGATHAATVFLGLEVVTLTLISLFVLPLTRPALEAGYKLLILGGIGAGTILFGFALVYAGTGKLGIDAWSQRGLLISFGAALLLSGFAFKLSLFPFQMWTPDAFTGAPAASAAFAGVVSKTAVAIALLRVSLASPPEPIWRLGLGLTGGASILLANLQALRQNSLARMLGYSSIAHSGYLAATIASGAEMAPGAVLFYVASYAPALIGTLCVAGLLGDATTIDDVRGLIWRNPLMGAVLVLSLLSLAGLPPTVGFLAKVYVFLALIQAEAWGLLAVLVTGSAIGLYVYFRFIAVACRRAPRSGTTDAAWADTATLMVCAVILIVFGVYPAPLIDAVGLAAP